MRRFARFCSIGALMLASWPISAFAQVGRAPVPGRSTYPGGRSGTGLPPVVPQDKKPNAGKQQAGEPLADIDGTLRSMTGKTLTIETAESNTIEFRYSKKTGFYEGTKKVKPSSLKPGDRVTVEARRAPDGSTEAVNVRCERRKS